MYFHIRRSLFPFKYSPFFFHSHNPFQFPCPLPTFTSTFSSHFLCSLSTPQPPTSISHVLFPCSTSIRSPSHISPRGRKFAGCGEDEFIAPMQRYAQVCSYRFDRSWQDVSLRVRCRNSCGSVSFFNSTCFAN